MEQNENTLSVLKIAPGQYPQQVEIDNDLKALQQAVGGPFGAKSISEIACNGAAPAIGIAIHDACGVWVRSWPMTPEKILKALGKL